MMRRGRQAADDGSFARSVGVHTARGAVLIGIAVFLGIVLLQKVDSGKSVDSSVRAADSTTVPPTTAPAVTTTTRSPTQVKVLVANGTTTSGVAATAKRTDRPSRLQRAGAGRRDRGGQGEPGATRECSTRPATTATRAKIAALVGLTPAPQPLADADHRGAGQRPQRRQRACRDRPRLHRRPSRRRRDDLQPAARPPPRARL